ncbi:hypothetical protein Vafri_7014 [Volvox africanus]|uniref:Uncharacterized protein n=1 Tax=Volvox africanus TaxID=51714 RepID=A0A8J4B3L7_9CHLO|nr:hypothetical protein Vafri_7014 [Volvox africanus]
MGLPLPRSLVQDVAQLQLPLVVLAPLPTYHETLLCPTILAPPIGRALDGTASALRSPQEAARASGARLRKLILNDVDLRPQQLETICEMKSLEQLLVFFRSLELP